MYCIASFEKVKNNSDLTTMANHNYRIHLNTGEKERIDPKRMHLNQVLLNPLNIDTSSGPDFTKKINQYFEDNDVQKKSDSVLAIDLVISTSPEFWQDNNGTWHKNGKIRHEFEQKIKDWTATQLEFITETFGKEAVKSAVLHLDETSPHIHFLITPEETKTKTFKNQYGTKTKTETSLNANRYNPLFWKNFVTKYAVANKKYGLKRGEEGSVAENVSIKQYHQMIKQASELDYSKAIEKIIKDLGDDLSIMNTKEGVKKLLLEKLLPSLNPLFKQNKALKKVLSLDRVNEYKIIKKMKEELKMALNSAEERKELYIKAINEKSHDAALLLEMQVENNKLKKEVERLKKFEVIKDVQAEVEKIIIKKEIPK